MMDTHYLGVDFAIHSSLLIAMTWLIPYFILKKSQPSLEKTVMKGLNKGLVNAFSIIENEVLSVVDSLAQQHMKQQRELSGIMDHCSAADADQNLAVKDNSPLARMLVN